MRNLHKENRFLIDLVQASLGSISQNMRGVWFTYLNAHLVFEFVLEKDNSEDREEVVDMLFEFEALQNHALGYDYKVLVSDADLEIPENARCLYLRKE